MSMLTNQEISGDDCELDCERPSTRQLTDMQRRFVAAYVTNGRNARQAALAAGTSPKSAAQRGYMNIRNPVILQAIKDSAVDSIVERIPVLVDAMVDLALDPKASAVARVSAFRELVDRAGMAVQRGPMIQINNGMTDPKAQAQALIAEIWTEKNTREARKERVESYVGKLIDDRKSNIDGGMSDIIDNDAPWRPAPAQAPGTGGERRQGPIAGACPIPPPPTENAPAPLGFSDTLEVAGEARTGAAPGRAAGGDALAAWRDCVSRGSGVIADGQEGAVGDDDAG